MINVYFYFVNKKIIGFRIEGHAKYAPYGQDIVCAAVSTISQAVVKGLMQVQKMNITYNSNEKAGYMEMLLKERVSDAQVLLQTMLVTLEDIEQQYPNNVKIHRR